MKPDTSLSCNMDVFTVEEHEKHEQRTRQLYGFIQDIRETENGFVFDFPNTSETITGLAQFLVNERLCCPFLEFTLVVNSTDQPVSLHLAGPEGTKEFLQAEIGEAFV